MAPPCQSFPARHLPLHVQVGPDGRKRKTEGGKKIDLVKDCELLSLVQYECQVFHPELWNSPVGCWPIQRWFRRCQDAKGKFMVETTAWEGTAAAAAIAEAAIQTTAAHPSQTGHWTPSWEDEKKIPRWER
ncbi:hypothetical protein QBC46DRAFT_379067 [Diplogelasinospora grovesii]|uniref:Uncharacterized protein n=1 Tax=Diplogelasinospora grovesii TaxID=303347 RepID=A0AAN6NFS8_9PEZI|nr:hypothetical protein QBC46DRAFT_379067 [Diplogelasinospora grovesii]